MLKKNEIHIYSLNYNQSVTVHNYYSCTNYSIYTSLKIRAIFIISILAAAQNFPSEIKQFHSFFSAT